MVETNPAAVLLDVAQGGKNSFVDSRNNSDGGAFSREFAQVSRASGAQKGTQSPVASGTAGMEEEPAQISNDLPEQDDVTASEAETEEQFIAAGGNKLPPVATVEDEGLPAESEDEVLSLAQVETVDEVVQIVAQQEVKQTLALPGSEGKQNVLSTGIDSGAKAERAVDDTPELSNIRTRDLNSANMFTPGKDGGEQATAQQGKSDSALFTMVNGGNRGTAAFGEILNASTAGTIISNTATTQTSAALPAQASIAIPLQQHGWDQAMGERVVWMARSNIQQAQIQLNPRELGPIEIKISVQNDQTHVNFVAHHAATRDAIEAALPRLREMLGEQGLNLGQADVSQQSFGDSRQHNAITDDSSDTNGAAQDKLEDDTTEDEMTLHSSKVSNSAVDYFA